MSYLLDTNAVSELMRNPQGNVALRLEERPRDRIIRTSIVVVAEVRFGIERRRSARLMAQLDAILAWIRVEPWTGPADEHYGRIRAALERAGTPIGAYDLLIAAHALALGATLVTANLREFSRVPGLAVEDWTA